MSKISTYEIVKRSMDIVAFIVIVVGVILTVKQVKELNVNASYREMEYANSLYDKLNEGKNRTISIAIENNQPLLTASKGKTPFTSDDLDDYLDALTDVGAAYDKNLIDDYSACYNFFDVTTRAHNDQEVMNYIAAYRSKMGDSTYFSGFDDIYDATRACAN